MASFREVVQILITADSKQAIAAMKGVGDSADKDLKKATHGSRNLGDSFLKTGALLTGVGIAGFVAATRATLEFDKAMSAAGAASDATGKQLGALRQAALDAGRDTAFSATEAAQGITELAKAGISTTQILGGGLKGALDLAAAGEIDISEAALIAATSMNIFKLSGADVGHIADVLAAGANKSAADMHQLGDALSQGGLVANRFGFSLEETVGILAAFADNGLKGSDAGTSLKTALIHLENPSSKAAAEMQKLGLSVTDSAGNFVNAATLSGRLRAALEPLPKAAREAALGVIFGTDAVRGAGVLYDEGANGIKRYVGAVNDQGAATDTAAKKMDNLSGDLEKLRGSFETALIQGGSKGTGALRLLAQTADDAISGFSELPSAIQTGAVGLVAFSGVTLLAAGAVVKVKTQLDALATTAPRTAAALTGIGRAAAYAAAAAGAMYALTNALDAIFEISEQAADGIRNVVQATSDASALKKFNNEIERLFKLKNPQGGLAQALGFGGLIEGFDRGDIAIQAFNEVLKASPAAAQRLVDAMKRNGQETYNFQQRIDGAVRSQKRSAAVADEDAAAIGRGAAARKDAAGAAGDLNKQIEAQVKATDDAAKKTQEYVGSVRAGFDATFAWADANAQLDADMKDGNKSLEDRQKSLLEVVSSSSALAVQQLGPGASAAAKTKAGFDAQVESLFKLKQEYPALGPFIDSYIASLTKANEASQANANTNANAIGVLDALRAKYPELGPEIDKLVAKLQLLGDTSSGTDSSLDNAIGVLEALQAKYGDTIPEIQALIDRLKDPALTSPVEVPVSAPGAAQTKTDLEGVTKAHSLLPARKGEIVVTAPGAREAKDEIDGVTGSANLLPPRKGTQVDAPGAKASKHDIDEHNASAGKVPPRKGTRVDAPGAKDSKRQIDEHNAAAGRTPPHKDTSFSTSGIEGAISQVDRLRNAINTVPATKRFAVNSGGGAGGITFSAKGGPLRKDQSSIVGEEGDELWIPAKAKVPPKEPLGVRPPLTAPVLDPRATARVFLLGSKGESLFTPREPGTVIPHPQVPETLERLGLDRRKIPKRAKGGKLDDGETATVGEEGSELWIPAKTKVPPKVAAGARRPVTAPVLDKAATKGVMVLGAKGEELFTPPEPGTVIPHPQVPETLERLGLDARKVPKRAQGGRLKRREYGIVGEQGLELFWPDSAGPPPARLAGRPLRREPAAPNTAVARPTVKAGAPKPRDPFEQVRERERRAAGLPPLQVAPVRPENTQPTAAEIAAINQRDPFGRGRVQGETAARLTPPVGPDESAPRPRTPARSRELVGAGSAIARPVSVNFISGPESTRDQFSNREAIVGQGYQVKVPGRAAPRPPAAAARPDPRAIAQGEYAGARPRSRNDFKAATPAQQYAQKRAREAPFALRDAKELAARGAAPGAIRSRLVTLTGGRDSISPPNFQGSRSTHVVNDVKIEVAVQAGVIGNSSEAGRAVVDALSAWIKRNGKQALPF